MIVQPPEHAGEESFVILQNEHTAFAGQLASHFGNEEFQRREPADLVVSLIERHDEGWTDLDARFLMDVNTGQPYSLEKTPLAEAFPTLELSPTIGELRHPFIGLISSMHSVGLWTGRYGVLESAGEAGSGGALERALRATPPPEWGERADEMLRNEFDRQARLRGQLLADPATAHLAEDSVVLPTYKLLEFCDIFSLYVQCEHASRRREMQIPYVPVDDDPAHDVTVSITPLNDGRYQVSPYPFDIDPFVPTIPGRYLAAQPVGSDLAAAWSAADPSEQPVHLCS